MTEFSKACKNGDIVKVKLMIERGGNDCDLGANNWNDGLYGACSGGHKEIVKLMIDRGADDWNDGLYGACSGGHKEIVKLMIDQGADDWNYGL